MKIFDNIIVGKGLIGTAAAKYITSNGENVLLIGPDEPFEKNNQVVYSSHDDQARIQRVIGSDAIWTLLNLQSAKQYDLIEKETGISFHSKTGCLYVNPHGEDAYLGSAKKQAIQFNLQYDYFENDRHIMKNFPDFNFPEKSKGLYEASPGGFINPKLLIQAQIDILQKNGGITVNDVASDIRYNENHIGVTTVAGNHYKAKKVLLAPGAFINFFNLIKNKLALGLKSETTMLAEVSKDDAIRLSMLPSLLYEVNIAEYQNIYLIQPVKYPDGKYYLKVGCNLPGDFYFDNIKDIQEWFNNGQSDVSLTVLKHALQKIIPDLKVKNFLTKRCIVSFTKHRKPYIGALDDKGLFVACGGNGYSAMCSDALGRIASYVITTGNFPAEYPAEAFIPVFT